MLQSTSARSSTAVVPLLRRPARTPENRLTMSVEEASEDLGIFRSLAYEVVRRVPSWQRAPRGS